MKRKYKILIIVIIAFVPISIFFPQVFLVFHLDKFEVSDECNSLQGQWDWYSNTCNLSKSFPDGPTCESEGGRNTCQDGCGEKEFYNPWLFVLPRGCLDICVPACEFGYNSLVPREYGDEELAVGDIQITESTPRWRIPEELSKMGCTDAMITHLKKHSNILDEKWNNGLKYLEWVSLPEGMSQEALEQCMENLTAVRSNEN